MRIKLKTFYALSVQYKIPTILKRVIEVAIKELFTFGYLKKIM